MIKYNDEKVILELTRIIQTIGHFPKFRELVALREQSLIHYINKRGGFNKFRLLMGYKIQDRKPMWYWNDETILQETAKFIIEIGHFPTSVELHDNNKSDLSHAMVRHGGINKFRKLMGYELLQKIKYWNDETFKKEVVDICNEFGYFPTFSELYEVGRADILGQINNRGGVCNVRKQMGYPSIDISNINAYYSRRGKKPKTF